MEWNTSDKPKVVLVFFSFVLASKSPPIDYSYSSSEEQQQMVLI